jgi:hypothetical protein
MKFKNAPGRVNKRRIEAVERLEKIKFIAKEGRTVEEHKERINTCINRTNAKIINQAHADSIRTKKDRSAKAKLK